MEFFKSSFTIILSLFFLKLGLCNCGDLRKHYYRKRCPEAEQIVQSITWKHAAINAALPAKLLRMHFHDCFVRGCDASILIDSSANNIAEKDAIPNKSLAGFEIIDEIKTQLEQTCQGIVSCADIVALAARDSVSFQFNMSMWEVLTGRRTTTKKTYYYTTFTTPWNICWLCSVSYQDSDAQFRIWYWVDLKNLIVYKSMWSSRLGATQNVWTFALWMSWIADGEN